MIDTADHLFAGLVIVLGVVYPALDGPRFNRKMSALAAGPDPARRRLYLELLLWLWGMSILIAGYWLLRRYDFSRLGFRIDVSWRLLVVAGLMILHAVFMTAYCLRLKTDAGLRAQTRQKLAQSGTVGLIPTNQRELAYWRLCAISAASEEVIYRGFLTWYLTAHMNIYAGGIVSSLLFALAHSYQGKAGILLTGIYGIVLFAVYQLSGSLWPAIFIHVVQDLTAGLAGYISMSHDQNRTQGKAAAPSR